MSEQQNRIPLPGEQTPPPRQPDFLKGDDWMSAQIDNDFLDFDEPYRPPRYTMEREGVPFADVGELHIISGKPGNGKTGLMSQLEAATLGGQFGKTVSRQVGHIQRDDAGNIINDNMNRPIYQPRPVRILHIDTEQGKDDTIAFKNRVISMSGINAQEAKEHFFILRLRDTEEAKDRWRKILKAIWQTQPTDIFLDGMLDIVEDYNDQKECQPIIRKCMMLATHYDTSMWLVLHENPMADKLVGTLGSITQRKVSEIFTVRKHKQSEEKPSERRADRPDIYFTVQQLKARGRDVANWDFEVTTENGWGTPREIIDTPQEPQPVALGTLHSPEDIKMWITDAQQRLAWPATRSDVFKQIFEPHGVTDASEQKAVMKICLNRRFFIEQTKEEMQQGQRNPRLKINDEVITPF